MYARAFVNACVRASLRACMLPCVRARVWHEVRCGEAPGVQFTQVIVVVIRSSSRSSYLVVEVVVLQALLSEFSLHTEHILKQTWCEF